MLGVSLEGTFSPFAEIVSVCFSPRKISFRLCKMLVTVATRLIQKSGSNMMQQFCDERCHNHHAEHDEKKAVNVIHCVRPAWSHRPQLHRAQCPLYRR